MKHVQFTLIITGEIPDDIDPAYLFLVTIGAAELHEYETVHAEHLE